MATPTAQGRSIYGDPTYGSQAVYVVEPRPVAAAALVGIGAFFVVIEAFVFLIVGAFLSSSDFAVYGGAFVTTGILDAIVGVLLFAVAILIHSEPHHHVANGLFAVILVFVSFLVGYGGFFIGGILALIGGILAIAWRPPALGIVAVGPRATTNPPR